MSRASPLPQQGQVCVQFMNKLHELHQSRHLCDLVLELRNEKFYAHKVVLSAWSPTIYTLLADSHCHTEVIRIQYDNAEIFGSFLSFLYSGQMDEVAQDNMIQILHLATSLQVNNLRQVCEESLKRQVHIANIVSTYHVARKFRLPNLEEYALNYMQMNLPEAVKQADFLSLTPPRFNSFLSSGWVCVMKPEIKLFLIISWLGYDVKERQQYLVLLLRYIDWSSVANDFLNEISQTENFFTTNESSLYLLLQTLFSSSIPLGPYQDSFPGLRDKYAYLLDHIVQNSYVLPIESEEYFPVVFHLVNPDGQIVEQLDTTGVEREGSSAVRYGHTHVAGSGYSDHRESLELSSAHDLSNDSVIAGIGLGLKKVSIVETHTVFGGKTMFSSQAETGAGSKTRSKKTLKPYADKESSQAEMPTAESQLPTSSPSPSKVQKGSKKKRKGFVKKERQVESEDTIQKAVSTRSTKRGAEASSHTDCSSPSKRQSPVKVTRPLRAKSTEVTVARKRVTKKPSPVKQGSSETGNSRLNGRPRRLAASKFNVLEKLVPRKTKASLKQVVMPMPVVQHKPVEDRRHHSNICKEEEQKWESSDDEESDVEENDNVEGHITTHPDHDLPRKETRSTKLPVKFAGPAADANSKSSKDRRGDRKFTAVKKTGANNPSTLKNVLPPPTTVAVKPKEEPQMEAEDRSGEHEDKEEDEESEVEEIQITPLKRKCRDCEYTAPTQGRLENHMERVHGSRSTLFVCSVCQFECKWNKKFYEHMKGHFSGPPYVCDHEGCSWEAERIQVLLIHRRRHTGERPHKCPHCAACFKTRNNLIAHLKCHSESRDHECPVCHRRFRMKNTMEQHMVTHSDLRPYLCDTCGFSTKFQSHLISHKRIHTGEVFKCGFPMCTYSSPKRSQLKAHMRSHLNIRHHACHICDKSFVEKSHLVRHIKIHQDVRPHKCDQCEYSSTRVDKVNEHRRKYHSEEAESKRRQYKYVARSRKGEGKNRKGATSQKQEAPDIDTMEGLGDIDTIGPPIRPKRAKGLPPSLVTLASAAEVMDLRNPFPVATSRRVGRAKKQEPKKQSTVTTKGKVSSFETEGSKGRIQIDVNYDAGGSPVKKESSTDHGIADEPRLDNCVRQESSLDTSPNSSSVIVGHGRSKGPANTSHLTEEQGQNAVHFLDMSSLVQNTTQQGDDTAHKQRQHGTVLVDRSRRVPPSTHPSQLPFAQVEQQEQHMFSTAPTPHASAALLQQLAMSASSAGMSQQRPGHQGVADVNHTSTLLPQTTPDVEAASHILMSAMQQHHHSHHQLPHHLRSAAAVSAANSLASLSYGSGQQGLPRQPDGSTHVQGLLHPSQHAVPQYQRQQQQHHQRQQHHHQHTQQHVQLQQQQQQPTSQQSEEYNNGLNTLMSYF
ncbi:uncharacterized protein [Littorina saxatilis]|uniref:uncharacterized protein n=1 Tax=Littorina saxatilis TaxID=31220 RepID=UPI0038B4D54B